MDADTILSASAMFEKYAQVRPSVGAGILFMCPDDNTVLLIQRSRYVEEGGTWGLPGGTAERGEKPSDAAVRETQEEVGSMPGRTRLVDTLVKKDKRGEYHIFVIQIPSDEKELWTPKIKLNWESTQYKWFRLDSIPENLHSAIAIIQT